MTVEQPTRHAAQDALHALQQDLDALHAGTLGVTAFCARLRLPGPLRAGLPVRYGEVLDQLLDRMESSALFTDDSCSFSQSDLRANLRLWLDKAWSQLGRTPVP
jgi:hypothetical protein